jgi:hypothetical protein
MTPRDPNKTLWEIAGGIEIIEQVKRWNVATRNIGGLQP